MAYLSELREAHKIRFLITLRDPTGRASQITGSSNLLNYGLGCL